MAENIIDDVVDGLMEEGDDADTSDFEDDAKEKAKSIGVNIGKSVLKGVVAMGVN